MTQAATFAVLLAIDRRVDTVHEHLKYAQHIANTTSQPAVRAIWAQDSNALESELRSLTEARLELEATLNAPA